MKIILFWIAFISNSTLLVKSESLRQVIYPSENALLWSGLYDMSMQQLQNINEFSSQPVMVSSSINLHDDNDISQLFSILYNSNHLPQISVKAVDLPIPTATWSFLSCLMFFLATQRRKKKW